MRFHWITDFSHSFIFISFRVRLTISHSHQIRTVLRIYFNFIFIFFFLIFFTLFQIFFFLSIFYYTLLISFSDFFGQFFQPIWLVRKILKLIALLENLISFDEIFCLRIVSFESNLFWHILKILSIDRFGSRTFIGI